VSFLFFSKFNIILVVLGAGSSLMPPPLDDSESVPVAADEDRAGLGTEGSMPDPVFQSKFFIY
jgi:hypothetical protein